MDIEVLERAGLTKNEAKVYLTCLRIGLASASEIAQNSGVGRGIIYLYLETLIKKGLISSIHRNNKKYFEAIGPERLIELLRDSEREILSALPELTKINESKTKSSVKFFEGKEGLKVIFEDIVSSLNKNDVYYVAGARAADLLMLKYFLPAFHKSRIKKGIHMRIIYTNDESSIKRAKLVSKMKFTEVRILPENYQTASSVHIYNGKVAIMIVPDKEEQLAILIENQKITDSMKKFFDVLWSISKKV